MAVVVAGASAGGVAALTAFVGGLPVDLPAAVLVVMHLPEGGQSELAQILDRSGPLAAATARDGEPIRSGRVYVAANNRHLLVKRDHVLLSRAPKQNRARPSIDSLFRSAARWYGSHVVGVVLSGSLDDGASGLAAIASLGGAAVVQEPREASVSGMPRSALAVVPQAVVSPAARIGAVVTALLERRAEAPGEPPGFDLIRETEMLETPRSSGHGPVPGEPVALSCPDCSGGLSAIQTGPATHYLCHVGHSWSPRALAAAQQEKVEQAIWMAISMLEEPAAVFRRLAERAVGPDGALTVRHQLAAADEAMRAAGVIRKNFPELLPDAGAGTA
ncbi:chemotaxis protein CheB [Paractinoplanes rishiriensis]|nr:chemotaxis protein CheB [Actinoplanes rishiriensis]